MRLISLLAVVLLLQGCSIKQNITPVTETGMTDITIIENPAVKTPFRDAITAALEEHGITTQLGPAGSMPEDHPYALTYTANWTWDMALYLVYAEINVYKQGDEIGKAVYDATGGGYRMDKFINAEEKVHEMVGQLLGSEPIEEK
jgi:hypothetical protein